MEESRAGCFGGILTPASATGPAALRVFPTPAAIGAHLAERILRGMRLAAQDGRRYLLGAPTGRTPRPVYEAMAHQLARAPQSLRHVTLVMMDEYVVSSPDGFVYATAEAAPSCHAFTRDEIIAPVNAVLPAGAQLADDQVWFPDPADPAAYDQRIAMAGGINFFLLASGAGDGHVAFNPPGSPRQSLSRIVELSDQTRRDNLITFPALGTLDRVPRFGVTVGIATILAAHEQVMVAWGEGKRTTVQRMRDTDRYDASWPATLIHECEAGEILVDEAAAGAVL